MKKFGKVIIFFIVFFTIGSTSSSAMTTGFITEPCDQETVDFLMMESPLEIFTEEPSHRRIHCFDVREDGMIALVMETTLFPYQICVYSRNGVFQYGFSYYFPGNCAVEWDGDNIILYGLREDLALSVDPQGNILEIVDVPSSDENDEYYESLVASKREFSGRQYKTSFFSTKLTVTNADGDKKVLYRVGNLEWLSGIPWFFVLLFLMVSGVYFNALFERDRGRTPWWYVLYKEIFEKKAPPPSGD